MKIERFDITIRDLVKGYNDDREGGVTGYDGLLDIRPEYQREFVYKDKQREAVINSVKEWFPLNVMYWAEREDGTFEVIDGQQRTISIGQYVNNDFSIKGRFFHNLQTDEQTRILDYKLTIYICSGRPSEKLKWYEIINIAGEVLYPQELRNAVYAGSWLADARRHFSRPGGPAYSLGKDYLTGSPIRQDYLETVLKWIKHKDQTIEDYMGEHQHDSTAGELWRYFQSVIRWVGATFTKKRASMKGVQWGDLYNDHNDRRDLDPVKIEAEVAKLVLDDDVTKKSGIYPYILTGDEKHLNIRAFTKAMKLKVYEKQGEICRNCKKPFKFNKMEADHITPWIEGGKTAEDNCQILCKRCNREKSSK